MSLRNVFIPLLLTFSSLFDHLYSFSEAVCPVGSVPVHRMKPRSLDCSKQVVAPAAGFISSSLNRAGSLHSHTSPSDSSTEGKETSSHRGENGVTPCLSLSSSCCQLAHAQTHVHSCPGVCTPSIRYGLRLLRKSCLQRGEKAHPTDRERIAETESAVAQSFNVEIASVERCKVRKKKRKQNETRLIRTVSLVGTPLRIIRSSSGVVRVASFGWSWCKTTTQQQLLSREETSPPLWPAKSLQTPCQGGARVHG